MNHPTAAQVMAIPALEAERASGLQRSIDWFVAARSHRVMCLLAGLWVINAFDIVLTILAHHQGMLDEQNPIARRLLLHSPYAMLMYKASLVTFASLILYTHRTRLVSELAAGGMLLIYTVVAIRWRLCYELYMMTHAGDAPGPEIDAVNLTMLTSHFTFF